VRFRSVPDVSCALLGKPLLHVANVSEDGYGDAASPDADALRALPHAQVAEVSARLEQIQAHYGLAALDNRERLRPTMRGFKGRQRPALRPGPRRYAADHRAGEPARHHPARVPVHEIVKPTSSSCRSSASTSPTSSRWSPNQAEGDLLRLLTGWRVQESVFECMVVTWG
jgi:hypothetical protein